MACADHARGGTRHDHLGAGGLALLGAHHAAVGLRDKRLGRHARLAQRILQRAEVAADARLHVGMDGGGDRALVLADDRPDVGRAEHGYLRRHLPHQGSHLVLVGGIAVGIQERHDDAFGTRLARLCDGGLDAGPVDRPQFAAVARQAPRDRKDTLPGDERRGTFRKQVVDIRRSQPGHLEHVGEPFGREMAEPDALALDHGVHAHGGAVAEMDDLAGSDAEARLELTEALQHLGARPVGARRHFQGLGFQGGLVEHEEVGERAPDIDSNAIGHPDSPARPPGTLVRPTGFPDHAHRRANPSGPGPVCQTARLSRLPASPGNTAGVRRVAGPTRRSRHLAKRPARCNGCSLGRPAGPPDRIPARRQ